MWFPWRGILCIHLLLLSAIAIPAPKLEEVPRTFVNSTDKRPFTPSSFCDGRRIRPGFRPPMNLSIAFNTTSTELAHKNDTAASEDIKRGLGHEIKCLTESFFHSLDEDCEKPVRVKKPKTWHAHPRPKKQNTGILKPVPNKLCAEIVEALDMPEFVCTPAMEKYATGKHLPKRSFRPWLMVPTVNLDNYVVVPEGENFPKVQKNKWTNFEFTNGNSIDGELWDFQNDATTIRTTKPDRIFAIPKELLAYPTIVKAQQLSKGSL